MLDILNKDSHFLFLRTDLQIAHNKSISYM